MAHLMAHHSYYTISANPIYMDPDYNSPLSYCWGYCNLSIHSTFYITCLKSLFSGHHGYVCKLCGMKFKTSRMFEGHVKKEHPAANPRLTLQTVSRSVTNIYIKMKSNSKLIFTYLVSPALCHWCNSITNLTKFKTSHMFAGHVKQEHPAANPRLTLQTVSRLVI